MRRALTSLFVGLFGGLVTKYDDLPLRKGLLQDIESVYAAHGDLSNGG